MKEKRSRRYINRKIEEMFSNKKTPKKKKLAIKVKNYWFALGGIFLLFAWLYYFFNREERGVVLQSLNEYYVWQTTHSIIATPVLLDVNQNELVDVVLADLKGQVSALEAANREMIFTFNLRSGVLSPLSKVKINPQSDREQVLVTSSEGDFYLLDETGNYLYDSREEFFNEPIWSKAGFAFYDESKGIVLMTGTKGSIWAFDVRYGQVFWENKSSPLQAGTLLPSPVIVGEGNDLGVVIASEEGEIGFFDMGTGFLNWHHRLAEPIKATPLLLRGADEVLVFVISLRGDYLFLSLTGEVFKAGKISDGFVSTPNLVYSSANEVSKIVLTSQTGNVYYLDYSDFERMEVEKIYQLKDDSFLSSPVVLDLNFDGHQDLILVSRNGKIMLMDGLAKKLFFSPFIVESKFTATPLVADVNGDGDLEIIASGEDGRVFFLTLKTMPEKRFKKNVIIYGEFLQNSKNQNNFNY